MNDSDRKELGGISTESGDYLPLSGLVKLASEGRLEDVLLGLAERIDVASAVEVERAVRSYNYKTDNPKASWAEAENAGVALCADKPIIDEQLEKSLIAFAQGKYLKKILDARNAEGMN